MPRQSGWLMQFSVLPASRVRPQTLSGVGMRLYWAIELVAFLAVEVEDQVHAPLSGPGVEPLPGELLGASGPCP